MPIRDFLGDDGDLAVVGNDFGVVGGDTDEENQAACVQMIGTALGMLLGESFLDQSVGVDYLGKILVRNPNPSTVQAELSTAIEGVVDVTTVQSAGLVGPTPEREASINYVVQTAYSSQATAGTVSVPTTS